MRAATTAPGILAAPVAALAYRRRMSPTVADRGGAIYDYR